MIIVNDHLNGMQPWKILDVFRYNVFLNNNIQYLNYFFTEMIFFHFSQILPLNIVKFCSFIEN